MLLKPFKYFFGSGSLLPQLSLKKSILREVVAVGLLFFVLGYDDIISLKVIGSRGSTFTSNFCF